MTKEEILKEFSNCPRLDTLSKMLDELLKGHETVTEFADRCKECGKLKRDKEIEQTVATSFIFGTAFGFASNYDEKDKILKNIREIIYEKELCADTISRKAAIESIKNLYPDMPVMDIMGARRKWLEKYAPYFECENAIEHLPPVNPIKTVTNAKEAEEYQIRPSDDKKSCDNCKHNTESWDSDACDGCCEANSKWSGESYPGEFEAMEHNSRMDALKSEEQA